MKQYSVYTKLDGHIGKFSGGGSDVTKAYVDEQLETKANKTELAEYAKTAEVTKTVSSEIAKVIADAPASFDTLKEISDWIDTHEDSASAMNTAIQKNTSDISSLQISKANSTDLTAHTDNSDIHVTLEEKSNFHTHNNKNYLDKISENSSGNLTYNGKEITGGSTITDISDCAVDTIEEVGERTPISPKDKMKLIVGKIVKIFADIKNIAFSGSIADITDFDTVLSTSLLSTESGKRALDEAVGKILNDKIEEIKNLQGSTDISAIGDGTVTGALSVLNSKLDEQVVLKIVTFADGTDEEINAMLEAHYNNKINIADYWAVGDTRNVSLSAMSATGVGESHRAQTVQFVIGDFEHDDLVTSINGHTKAAVTLLQKDCLMDAANTSNPTNGSGNTENGYMNSSDTNVGGWKSCARRTWCNNVYFSALPSALQSMVKTVNKKVSVGNSSSTIETVQDKIFFAAEIEIFGSTQYSVAGEGTQYQFYKNATANRYKMPKWNSSVVSNIYWQRSPSSGNTTRFCIVDDDGNAYGNNASNAGGVAPCLCI